MKIIGYCIIHYGKEYLSAAIEAVYETCDEIVILYTPKPSHGHGTDAACPETREQILAEAKKFDPDNKVHFREGTFHNEGEHRGEARRICEERGADLIVVFDADEIWEPESLKRAAAEASKLEAKYIGINGYVNFWRSFNDACYDGFTPIRLINVHHKVENQAVINATIYHFSLAQGAEAMRYKYLIHGHASEIRKDWLDTIYFKWERGQGDLHPTTFGLWNAVEFDKNTLPEVLKKHVNFDKDVI